MTSLRSAIIPKSDQLNADDLISGPITITVTKVRLLAAADQKIAIDFDGDGGKPYKPCKSMCRVLVMLWGDDGNAYAGRRMRLWRDPKVKWAGAETGGIRISHMSHITERKQFALTETRGSRKPYTVDPLKGDELAKSIDEIAKSIEQNTPAAIDLYEEGQQAASRGTDVLKTFWERLKPIQQKHMAGQIGIWKNTAALVDQAPIEEDPTTEETEKLTNIFNAG